MLTSHCNNLSTHHYYLTYHPCFDTQFCHGQTTQRYFRAVAMSSRKKRNRSSCPFLPWRVVKRKKNWADKIVASDKRVLLHAARVRESCAGQLCGGDFVALFISADHVDQKATCIVSYPAQLLPFLPSCSHLGKHYCLGEFNFCFTGISGSCVIPSLAHSASPLIFVPATFFPFSVSLGISNVVLAYS